MSNPDDWRFPTDPRSRHPAAEYTRRSLRDESVARSIDEWSSTARTRAPRPKRRSWRRALLRGLLALLLVLGVAAVATAWLVGQAYRDRIYPEVVVGDVPVGSLTPDEARDKLEARVERYLENPITLRLGDRTWQPSAEDLGLSVDVDGAVDRARARREGPVVLSALRTLLGRQQPLGVPLVASLEPERLRQYLEDIGRQVNREPEPVNLRVTSDSVAVVGGEPGYTFLPEETEGKVRDALEAFQTSAVELQVFETPGAAPPRALRQAQLAAQRAVSAPLVLEAGGRRWELPRQRLVEWLRTDTGGVGGARGVRVYLDPTELRQYLQGVATQAGRPPRDARYQWRNNQLEVLEPGRPGQEVDVARAAAAVQAAALSDERLVRLPLRDRPPRVAEGNPGALGITTRLAAGAASFTGAPPEHSGNARRAADAVTGYVVLTGEEFSFATAVGPVSERDGYTPELVGDNVRGLQGPWAGLSEASTAVYRAALRAGLPITQRSHAPYRVPYFEQAGQPLGTEAVVTIPGEDLRFVNDTQAALLVQVIPGPDQLRAEIYGAPTGRTVRLSAPVLGVEAPPGPPVEWRDPALPSGQTRRVAAEAPGGTVTLTRRLLRGAQAPGQDRILSQYAGLPEITARGTK